MIVAIDISARLAESGRQPYSSNNPPTQGRWST